jgi:hypothetical protein
MKSWRDFLFLLLLGKGLMDVIRISRSGELQIWLICSSADLNFILFVLYDVLYYYMYVYVMYDCIFM